MFARARRPVAAVMLLLAGGLLTGCAYQNPVAAPSPVPSVSTAPAAITLSAVNGVGASAGKVYVSAKVADATGKAVGDVAVVFATTTGAVAPSVVQADGFGQAQTIVTTTGQADVSAHAGGISAALTVTPNVAVDPFVPPPPVILPTPPPSPVPPPSAPPPPEALRVDVIVNANPGPAGRPLFFNATATAEIVAARWDFGDGATAQTATGQTTHAYASAGTRTATVIVTDRAGRTATGRVVVSVTPAYNATIGCVTSAASVTSSGLTASCTVTLYQSGDATASPSLVIWDWADGNGADPGPPSKAHTFPVAGTYTIHATMPAPDGSTVVGQATVTVPKT